MVPMSKVLKSFLPCLQLVGVLLLASLVLWNEGVVLASLLRNINSVSAAHWFFEPDATQAMNAARSVLRTLELRQRWWPASPVKAGSLVRWQAAVTQGEYRVARERIVERAALASFTREMERVGSKGSAKARLLADEVARLQPTYTLRDNSESAQSTILREVMPGWHLLGYDLPGAPFLGPADEVDIVLYWERDEVAMTPGMAKMGNWRLVWTGNRVYQTGRVTNLASNGGFERTLDLQDAKPVGWPSQEFTSNDPGDLALHLDRRNGVPTVVAFLDHTDRQASGWRSKSIPVQSNAIYLHAGWVRTEGASSFGLACGWYGIGQENFQYSTWAIGKASHWTHYAGLTRPPLLTAVRASLWLQSRNQGGRVYFDDVLFVSLDLAPLHHLSEG